MKKFFFVVRKLFCVSWDIEFEDLYFELVFLDDIGVLCGCEIIIDMFDVLFEFLSFKRNLGID